MKYTKLIISTILASAVMSQASWVWTDFAVNPSGTSGTTDFLATGAGYGPENPPTLNNGLAWDLAPEAFQVTWTASTDVTLDITSDLQYLEVRPTDPTFNGKFDLVLDFTYPFHLAVRDDKNNGVFSGALLNNGALGAVFDTQGLVTIDNATLYSETADGSPVALNTATTETTPGLAAGTAGLISLMGQDVTNTSGNVGDFGAITAGGYNGLDGTVANSDFFAWPAILGDPTTPSLGLGRQVWSFTGVDVDSGSDVVRFSFDGGVPAGALPTSQIPEPTSFALLGLGALGLVTRRKR